MNRQEFSFPNVPYRFLCGYSLNVIQFKLKKKKKSQLLFNERNCFIPFFGSLVEPSKQFFFFELIWIVSYSCLALLTLKGHVLLPCQICITGFFLQASYLRIPRKPDSVFGFFTLNLHHVRQQGNAVFWLVFLFQLYDKLSILIISRRTSLQINVSPRICKAFFLFKFCVDITNFFYV